MLNWRKRNVTFVWAKSMSDILDSSDTRQRFQSLSQLRLGNDYLTILHGTILVQFIGAIVLSELGEPQISYCPRDGAGEVQPVENRSEVSAGPDTSRPGREKGNVLVFETPPLKWKVSAADLGRPLFLGRVYRISTGSSGPFIG